MINNGKRTIEAANIPCSGILNGILLLTLLSIVGVIILLASVPPVSRDALVHHLAVPKIYLQGGGMVEIPSMVFSYYPMNLDLLFLIPLSFNNDIIPKYIHFLFALFTAGLIYKYLKDQLSTLWGLVGALFFVTIPVIVKLSVTVYVDLGLIFFSWANLYFILRWEETNFKFRYLLFAAACCGLALGTKYNALMLLFFMASCIPLWYSRSRNRKTDPNDHRQRYRNSLVGIKWGGRLCRGGPYSIFSLGNPQLYLDPQPRLSPL